MTYPASASEKYITSKETSYLKKYVTVLQIYSKYSVIVYELFGDSISLIFLLTVIFQTHTVGFIL